jgi:hypothetical protein
MKMKNLSFTSIFNIAVAYKICFTILLVLFFANVLFCKKGDEEDLPYYCKEKSNFMFMVAVGFLGLSVLKNIIERARKSVSRRPGPKIKLN